MSGFSPINRAGSLTSKFKPIEEGWFDKTKRDKMFSNWQRRMFVLDFNNKSLTYYTDEEKTQYKVFILLFIIPP